MGSIFDIKFVKSIQTKLKKNLPYNMIEIFCARLECLSVIDFRVAWEVATFVAASFAFALAYKTKYILGGEEFN